MQNIDKLYETRNYNALLKVADSYLNYPITARGIQTSAKIRLWVIQQQKIDAGELSPCEECGGIYEDLATGKNSPHPHIKPLEKMTVPELMAWTIANRDTENGQEVIRTLREENRKQGNEIKWINDLLSMVETLYKS